MNRMTDERLAEIDDYVATLIEDNILEVDDALPELLQALKAERERIEELEADLLHANTVGAGLEMDNTELEVQLRRKIEAGLKLEQEWRAGVIGSNEAMTRLREALEAYITLNDLPLPNADQLKALGGSDE